MKAILGGKGANLAEMTRVGLNVPPGFTITTAACNHYLSKNKKLPGQAKKQISNALKKLEKRTGKKFGSNVNPLLVSVRSGSAVSMPGMMDTVLNLGLNDETVEALATQTNDKRFALDAYRRFIQMFSDVVLGVSNKKFEKVLENEKKRINAKNDSDLNDSSWEKIITKYKEIVKKQTNKNFPSDPETQLDLAIKAVFDSWNVKRAITYRKANNIPDNLGTGVNVQSMVFGNMGKTSGTGVAFTRNPSNGKKEFYGEYLVNAQGEDVVAGIRTPKQIKELKKELPEIYKQLETISKKLEKHFRDVQDMEFTFEKGKLFMLQTRKGKRTPEAAVKIAVDLNKEKLISKKEAVLRIEPTQLDKLLHRRIDPKADVQEIGTGLAASPGAAAGKIVFDADTAEMLGRKGRKVLLVAPETTPDDIHGMIEAQGILTARGGMTSHAAVVARGMGKPCIAGCDVLKINEKNKTCLIGSTELKEGDVVTIDGTTGKVILGRVPTIEPTLNPNMEKLLRWADSFRTLGVRTNADNPEDSSKARMFGAEGIGLCRTEHMFMDKKRLPIVRKMILSRTLKERKNALKKLLPMQRNDFYGIFKAMSGYPVIIRLLDPPLHEFLPNKEELMGKIVKLEFERNKSDLLKEQQLYQIVSELSESNPMLGHRGCRLGIVFPEIYEMQVQAIFEAAVKAAKRGFKVKPQVMIPLVGVSGELKELRQVSLKAAKSVLKKYKKKIPYKIGTMIELPRACLVADRVAEHADFFSFGTNDLTQTTFGFSRDDVEAKFMAIYLEKGILPENPFMTLDSNGVGILVDMAVKKARKIKKNFSVGICGEHGGDPESIKFCHSAGLDYVSCSPYRVPVARLASAHAALGNGIN